jgi:hypothetical protein
MQKKLNSKQIMDIMQSAQDSISRIDKDVNYMKAGLAKRLELIKNIQAFNSLQATILRDSANGGASSSARTKFLLARTEAQGIYDTFGFTVHPKFIKEPINVFNISSSVGYIYKNNATVSIDGVQRQDMADMLIHDSIAEKGVAFACFDHPEILVEVKVDENDVLGSTDFNIIELLPYIPGSFTIRAVSLYTMQSHKDGKIVPDFYIMRDLRDFSASRVMIDKTRTLYRCVFSITLNYKNEDGMYPFGIKHLYFLKGEYNAASNIVFKASHGKYINTIGENIRVIDQNGEYESSCTEEGIKLYMDYSDGELKYEIPTSQGLIENPLSKNIKDFYVSMPVDRSITSIEFTDIKSS